MQGGKYLVAIIIALIYYYMSFAKRETSNRKILFIPSCKILHNSHNKITL